MEFKIDVVGVGFPKCGTSWLSNMMATHPEISMAKAKETFYFIKSEQLFRKDHKALLSSPALIFHSDCRRS